MGNYLDMYVPNANKRNEIREKNASTPEALEKKAKLNLIGTVSNIRTKLFNTGKSNFSSLDDSSKTIEDLRKTLYLLSTSKAKHHFNQMRLLPNELPGNDLQQQIITQVGLNQYISYKDLATYLKAEIEFQETIGSNVRKNTDLYMILGRLEELAREETRLNKNKLSALQKKEQDSSAQQADKLLNDNLV